MTNWEARRKRWEAFSRTTAKPHTRRCLGCSKVFTPEGTEQVCSSLCVRRFVIRESAIRHTRA